MEMKRTNVFMEPRSYQILDIKSSKTGPVLVIDSLNNLRLYDVWNSVKMARLTARGPLENKVINW